MDKLLTVKEVSEILKKDRQSIILYINEKKIKAYKVGNTWRIRENELINYLNSVESK